MSTTIPSPHSPEAFVLAGRNADGIWHRVATTAVEAGETAEEARTFLQTMAHASFRSFQELEILTAAEFADRQSPDPLAA
jgi:hypothetical protein